MYTSFDSIQVGETITQHGMIFQRTKTRQDATSSVPAHTNLPELYKRILMDSKIYNLSDPFGSQRKANDELHRRYGWRVIYPTI